MDSALAFHMKRTPGRHPARGSRPIAWLQPDRAPATKVPETDGPCGRLRWLPFRASMPLMAACRRRTKPKSYSARSAACGCVGGGGMMVVDGLAHPLRRHPRRGCHGFTLSDPLMMRKTAHGQGSRDSSSTTTSSASAVAGRFMASASRFVWTVLAGRHHPDQSSESFGTEPSTRPTTALHVDDQLTRKNRRLVHPE